MKTLTDQLANYAAYHRDPRNITTHFIGIPMIVLAIATLLSRPAFMLGGLPLTPALALTGATVIYYLLLELRLGALMAVLMALNLYVAWWLAGQPTALWLGAGMGLFVVGWVFQFVGHYYEGKKPAFVDDIMGLIIGPLFVVAEVVFALGLFTSARIAEQVRSGLESLPRGQRYAGMAVGFTTAQTYRYVLLPMALRIIIPPLTSETMNIFKNSSVAFAVSVAELTMFAMQAQEETSRGVEIYLAVTALYVVSAFAINRLMAFIERRSRVPGFIAAASSGGH